MTTCNPTLDRRHAIALLGAFGVGSDALAQDAARANARGFSVVFENDHVRVLEFNARPGMGVCGQGVHSHPRHVNIAITAVKARVTMDGKSFVAEVKPGEAFWEDAVTHTVENIGGANASAYMVELKEPLPRA